MIKLVLVLSIFWISPNTFCLQISALLSISTLLKTQIYRFNNIESCTTLWPEIGGIDGIEVYTIFTFTGSFLVPIIVALFFLLPILFTSKRPGELQPNFLQETNLVTTVVAFHILLWLPYWVIQFYLLTHNEWSNFIYGLILFLSSLPYVNSGMRLENMILSDNTKIL